MKKQSNFPPDETAWTNYADWQARSLFPLAEKLMAHPNQPYSGNLLLSMKQACIRLGGTSVHQYAEMALAEINSTIIRMEKPKMTCEKCGSLLSAVTFTCVRGEYCK